MAVIDLIASIKSLTDSMIQFGKDFESRSLGLGLNFEQASQRLGKGFDQLHGDMSDRMQVGLQSVAAGLMTTDGGLSQLINQQKLTGQQWQNTAGVWANVVAAGVANEEAMKVLAENTINLGDTYTVQTSLLTGVIKSLERSMVDMGLADMGPQVLGAITELQAVMGPQQKANFEKINQMIFDTSIEGYQKLALLNIPNIREQLSAARTQGEASQLLMSAIKTAGMTIDDFTSDADQAFIRLGQAGQIFGDSAKLFSPVAKALSDDARKSTEERTRFFEQWNVMLTDVLTPLKMIATELLFPNLRNFVTAITDFGKVLVDKIKAFIGGFETTIITVATFKTVMLDTADKIVDAVEMIPGLFGHLFGSEGYLIQIFDAFSSRFTEKANEIWLDMQINHLIPLWTDIRTEFMVIIQHIKNAWEEISNPVDTALDEFKANLLGRALALSMGEVAMALKGDIDLPTAMEHAAMIAVREVRGAEEARGSAALQAAVLEKSGNEMHNFFRSIGLADDPGKMPPWEYIHIDKETELNRQIAGLRTDNADLVEQVAQINDKVPDPNDGGLLAESAFILGDAIERVLGFDPGSQGIDIQEEIRDLLAQIAEERGGLQQDRAAMGTQ